MFSKKGVNEIFEQGGTLEKLDDVVMMLVVEIMSPVRIDGAGKVNNSRSDAIANQ